MENKPDFSRMPVIPTEFKKIFEINGMTMYPGWYAVKVQANGLQGMRGVESRHETFETCEKACTVHNKWLGMSSDEIVQLYVQERFTHPETQNFI